MLCITHLPQIAARGDVHFRIAKSVKDGRTTTALTRLDPDGRTAEIGRMIAGVEVTEPVLESARDLIDGRRRSEVKAKDKSERRPVAKVKGRRSGA